MTSYNMYGNVDGFMNDCIDATKGAPDDLMGDAYGHSVGDAYGHSVGDAYGHTVGDAYGHSVGADKVTDATKKILAHAQRERTSPPAMDVVPVEHNVDDYCPVNNALTYQWYDVLGAAPKAKSTAVAASHVRCPKCDALLLLSLVGGKPVAQRTPRATKAKPVSRISGDEAAAGQAAVAAATGEKVTTSCRCPNCGTKLTLNTTAMVPMTPGTSVVGDDEYDTAEELIYGDEGVADPAQAPLQTPATASTTPAASTNADHFPKLRKLYSHFKAMLPSVKKVRLDTPESYKDFVSKKQFATLNARVNELRNHIEAHESDKHGGKSNALSVWEEILGADALSEHEVPLSLEPSAQGKVKCWREGDKICCSVALPGHDGKARIATTTTDLADAVDELVGYIDMAGIDPVEILGALPDLACVLGGGALVPQIAQAAPALLADPASKGDKPVIRKMVPENYAGKASLMALCQDAQKGDPQACYEWQSLAEVAEAPECEMLGEYMLDAANTLQIAQALKA